MDHLYAPWRTEYITGEKIEGCVFCYISKHTELDEKSQVLFRDEYCFVVMNKYPYTPGHFMIIPHFHTDSLEKLDPKVWIRMSQLAQQGVAMLKEGFGAEGVNMGMNLGSTAGAGIAEHIHLHLVPRFSRDTNFITTIAETRVYSTDFQRIYEKLKGLATEYLK
ncbi:HIT domain-containing protein [Hydrogenimonas thermophila]|uniref:HIT family protein n=1 Tax=Hydrogenimonas thermophila TaxID=223786 RepID=UPI0029373B1D|nr:HIT domain-containing protein [Hydrogenimonas thermophila]WOE68791.1 HIT domain-containing protein [Hydrogenimonas thermophila]WOE71301.1 HIT domain-containing protein [Hydrogenimonas thermophila]